MIRITAKNAAKQDFMSLMRQLVRTYQAFAAFDAASYRNMDLTVSQADVIFTLGNTAGLTFKDIGAQTLITKGTLTGVIDRLENKGLVKRIDTAEDRRCTQVVLTAKGKRMFGEVFPKHVARLRTRFDRLTVAERRDAQILLVKLQTIFSS